MKRAFISVYNKNKKLLNFSFFLKKKKYQIISTGGTFKFLKKNGLCPINISDITSFPEILDGRIKSIHPYIYAGILANRSIEKHIKLIDSYNIKLIDIVLIDCYPFYEMINNKSIEKKFLLEFIDIGGLSLIRAAAKNFHYVTAIIDSNDSKLVTKEIDSDGHTSLILRKKLAGKVFSFTSYYDSIISQYFFKEEKFPKIINLCYKKKMNLKYGENPHQKASFYIDNFNEKGAMSNFNQIHGKKISFNNIRDIDIAWKIVNQFSDPTCCIIKHSTPCGVASGKNIIEAFKNAYYSDSISSFGGVVAFNTVISCELAMKINHLFLEVIIAPFYEKGCIEILKLKKNLIIININNFSSDEIEYVKVDGGFLVQESDYLLNKKNDNYKIVTKKNFSNQEIKSLFFAQKVVKFVKSNAIVVARGTQTLGISGGQTNRIWAARQAINRALEKNKKELVLVSDAFFPFKDIIDEIANSKRIYAILQPGGSIRDYESIEACNHYGIAMAFTGKRYFKH
ncbi:bifunctional phosphoribosylaminoimidazolecarboxamide formyltransferase/IMP cyclohydrolase [Blattabacterium cuenoti]|uniref:bifunctional phosphoribosylaminoimidazolecarboxamide formyltransferase/IMP cyclohydrolase n=1 Tax=Blattabacterium cuenoti TaxID=1653831 RepID=UPI00163BEE85|nr:bifunctional phosphoribosylaminoimidazolecarboxamide formyltransferase/IMP cyclohydrolase [Blattabacterium cuenoti]